MNRKKDSRLRSEYLRTITKTYLIIQSLHYLVEKLERHLTDKYEKRVKVNTKNPKEN